MGTEVDNNFQDTFGQWNIESGKEVTTYFSEDQVSRTSSLSKPPWWWNDEVGDFNGSETDPPNSISGDVDLEPPPDNVEGNGSSSGSSSSAKDTNLRYEFTTAFENALDNQEPPISEEMKRLVRFLLMVQRGQVPTSPEIEEAAGILANVATEAEAELREKGLLTEDQHLPEGDGEAFNWVYGQAFEAALSDYLDGLHLPPGVRARKAGELRFAFYHPDLAESDAKEGVEALQADLLAKLHGAGLTAPEEWRADSASYDKGMRMVYSQIFSETVNGLVDSRGKFSDGRLTAYFEEQTAGMTEEEAEDFRTRLLQGLKALHYHPEWNVNLPNLPLLKTIVKEIESSSFDLVIGGEGVPATLKGSWPKANTSVFDNALKCDYQYQCELELRNVIRTSDPRLSNADILAIRSYLANPQSPISESLKAEADKIMELAQTAVQKKYSLPEGMKIEGSGLWSGNPLQLNTLMYAHDLQTSVARQIDSLPDGPLKILMKDYLKAIGDAIRRLQEQIFEIQEKDAIASASMNQAASDVRKGRLAKQEEALTKQKEENVKLQAQMEKANTIQSVMKWVGPITVAIGILATIASFGTMAPIAMAIVAIAMTATILDTAEVKIGDQTLSEALFTQLGSFMADRINDLLGSFGVHVDSQVGEIVGAALVIAITMTLTAGSGASVALPLLTQILMTSKVVTTTATVAGADAKTAMYISLAVMGFCMILSFVAMYKSAGKSGEIVQDLTAKVQVTRSQIEATNIALQTATGATRASLLLQKAILTTKLFFQRSALLFLTNPDKFFKGPLTVLHGGMAAMSGINGYANWNIDQIGIELVKIKADAERYQVEKEDTVQALMEMIRQLQKLSEMMASMLKGADMTQQKKYVRIDFPV